jgi:hypothetical protein
MLMMSTALLWRKAPSSCLLHLIFNCCVKLQIASYNNLVNCCLWGGDAAGRKDNCSVVALVNEHDGNTFGEEAAF